MTEMKKIIGTIKERTIEVITMLLFNYIAQLIVVHTVVYSILWLTLFSPKNSISNRLSPAAIVLDKTSDAKTYCQVSSGNTTTCM